MFKWMLWSFGKVQIFKCIDLNMYMTQRTGSQMQEGTDEPDDVFSLHVIYS